MKEAKIIPVFKGNCKQVFTNYIRRGRVAYLDQRLDWTIAITGILKSVRPGRTHHKGQGHSLEA